MPTKTIRLGLCCLASMLVLTQTGCVTLSALMGEKRSASLDTSLLEAQGYAIPPGGMPSPVAPSAEGGPRVILEVRGEERHLESVPLPVDRAVTIEDFVHEAKLDERLGAINVFIMRPNGTQPPVRLDTALSSKGKTTKVGTNYALLPGDHLIVMGDGRSPFERFVDTQLGKSR